MSRLQLSLPADQRELLDALPGHRGSAEYGRTGVIYRALASWLAKAKAAASVLADPDKHHGSDIREAIAFADSEPLVRALVRRASESTTTSTNNE